MTSEQIEEGKRAHRAALATRTLIVAFITVGALVIGLQLVNAFQTNDIVKGIETQQDQSTKRSQDIKRTADAIESCTTPGRDCFKRNQDATASAVGSINEVSIYAAACADKPRRQTVQQIQSCVIEALADAQRENP